MLLILIFAISPRFFPFLVKPKHVPADHAFLSQMATLNEHTNTDASNINLHNATAPEGSYRNETGDVRPEIRPRPFDPNTVSESVLLQMGLHPKLVRTLTNYRSKGGRFRKASDLARIYGMDQHTYALLAPYVSIAAHKQDITDLKASPYLPNHMQTDAKKATMFFRVDINAADTTAGKRLPGIGSRLAQRIVQFRERLGGFVSIEQVRETYALPDSTFQLIRPMLENGHHNIRKLNINTATVQELGQHPYIRYTVAKAIVAFREQHGEFDKPESLQRIMVVSDSIYKKVFPYLYAGSNNIP